MAARRQTAGGLSPSAAARLRPLLDGFVAGYPLLRRRDADPVELPHRYSDPRDVEVAALLCASLAYGRVDLFKPKLEVLLSRMGSSPAECVRSLDPAGAAGLLDGFVYRFNLPADVAVLLLGMGKALRAKGSLEALFAEGLGRTGTLHEALDAFTRALRDVEMAPIRRAAGRERGLGHLLPSPLGPGAAKRLNLFLRWMVRGPDEVDFGIWRQISPAKLMVPLDTHLHRMAVNLGLTRRRALDWRTAEEITASLRLLDAEDPVKYDFALCHFGMSGSCPARRDPHHCAGCALLQVCRSGARAAASSTRRGRGGATRRSPG